MAKVKGAMLKMQEIGVGQSKERDDLMLSQAALTAQNSALHERIKELEDISAAELKRHSVGDETMGRLESEIKAVQVLADVRDQENKVLQAALDKANSTGGELAAEKEHMAFQHDEVLRALRAEVHHLQEGLESDRLQFEEERVDVATRHDHEVNRLREDISQAHIKLEDQEDYIEKLTKMLMGNKSNFAKFIELKTENAGLQEQLQRGGVATGGGNAAGRRPPMPMRPNAGASVSTHQGKSGLRGRTNKAGGDAGATAGAGRGEGGGGGGGNSGARSRSRDLDLPAPHVAAPPPDSSGMPMGPGYLGSANASANVTPRVMLNREASDEELRILAGYAYGVSNSPPPRAVPPPAMPMNLNQSQGQGQDQGQKKGMFGGQQGQNQQGGFMLSSMRRR